MCHGISDEEQLDEMVAPGPPSNTSLPRATAGTVLELVTPESTK